MLVKAGLIMHDEVFKMTFNAFEKLEQFSFMINQIEGLQREKNSSFKGDASKKSGGLSIKNDGTYTRG